MGTIKERKDYGGNMIWSIFGMSFLINERFKQ
jgi:hypothetical protein